MTYRRLQLGTAAALWLLAGFALGEAPQRTPPADNSLCYVCHLTLQTEEITAKHLAEGIGCEKCHGLSREHMHDEMLMTKPDRLYGRKQVDAMCADCHDNRPGSVYVPGKGFALLNLREDLLDGDGWNTLTVEVRGPRAAVRLNGEEIGAVVIAGPREAHVGLHADAEIVVREILIQKTSPSTEY